jgi:hypothetical protein
MATPKQPRKSTRTKKATGVAAETEVPLASGADVESMEGSSTSDGNTLGSGETDSLDDRIRQRAYELYLARGGAGGSATDDWLEAERQLRGRQGLNAAQSLDATSP